MNRSIIQQSVTTDCRSSSPRRFHLEAIIAEWTSCGQGKNPDPPAELPAWVERYAARRYGADIPAAKRAWEIIVPTFYTGTGEHGTSIRAWPPSVATATPAAYNASAAPVALRLLLEAAASVPESGKSGIEYDLVMLGFEWMQTLFEVRQRSFSVGI
eukprot:COSAG04_NODE_2322_length_4333_cov_7.621871_3_plen_157_part_00